MDIGQSKTLCIGMQSMKTHECSECRCPTGASGHEWQRSMCHDCTVALMRAKGMILSMDLAWLMYVECWPLDLALKVEERQRNADDADQIPF